MPDILSKFKKLQQFKVIFHKTVANFTTIKNNLANIQNFCHQNMNKTLTTEERAKLTWTRKVQTSNTFTLRHFIGFLCLHIYLILYHCALTPK